MKKKSILLVSIIGLILLISVVVVAGLYLSIKSGSNCTQVGIGNTLVKTNETTGKTDREIYELLTKRYFDQYVNGPDCLGDKLKSYKIERIDLGDSAMKDQFSITYSVSPVYIFPRGMNQWDMGNGIKQGDEIVHKFSFVKVKHNSDGIGIDSMNTGP